MVPFRAESNPQIDQLSEIETPEVSSRDERKTCWRRRVAKYLKEQWSKLDSSARLRLGAFCLVVILGTVGYQKKDYIRSISLYKRRAKVLDYQSALDTPLSVLLHALEKGQIDRALVDSRRVVFLANGTWKQASLPPNAPEISRDLWKRMSLSGANVEALPLSLFQSILPAVPWIAYVAYMGFLFRMIRNMTAGQDMATNVQHTSRNDQVGITFQSVAGLDSVVEEVREVVNYLSDPERYIRVGARPPRGILLFGPPGSGKTLLAQAVAGEACVDLFLSCSASEFVEVFVGRGAARVRSLFSQAYQQAKVNASVQRSSSSWWWSRWLPLSSSALRYRRPTAILFIDELDALAKTRSSFNTNDEREQTLNQLLIEMDGFTSAEHQDVTLIVIAASNRADVLDPAVLRRFDRQIQVGYPDTSGRAAILKVHARKVVLSNDDPPDWMALARLTGECSGADLRNVVNDAALLAVREKSTCVGHRHLEHAIQRLLEARKNVKSGTEQFNMLLG